MNKELKEKLCRDIIEMGRKRAVEAVNKKAIDALAEYAAEITIYIMGYKEE